MRSSHVGRCSGGEKPMKEVKKAKGDRGGGNGNADEEEKQRCDSDGGARIHEEALKKTNGVADKRVVAAVETLLPIHPVRRRLVVTLNHLHLV